MESKEKCSDTYNSLVSISCFYFNIEALKRDIISYPAQVVVMCETRKDWCNALLAWLLSWEVPRAYATSWSETFSWLHQLSPPPPPLHLTHSWWTSLLDSRCRTSSTLRILTFVKGEQLLQGGLPLQARIVGLPEKEKVGKRRQPRELTPSLPSASLLTTSLRPSLELWWDRQISIDFKIFQYCDLILQRLLASETLSQVKGRDLCRWRMPRWNKWTFANSCLGWLATLAARRSLSRRSPTMRPRPVCFKKCHYYMVCCSTYIYVGPCSQSSLAVRFWGTNPIGTEGGLGPWTNKVIQIRNVFSSLFLILSETFPSQVLSAAVQQCRSSPFLHCCWVHF